MSGIRAKGLYQTNKIMQSEKSGFSEIKAYENLANAIIVKAVRDYQHALISLHLNPYNSDAESRVREIKRFVHSEFYHTLTKLDGDFLLKEAKKQVEERGWRRFDMGLD